MVNLRNEQTCDEDERKERMKAMSDQVKKPEQETENMPIGEAIKLGLYTIVEDDGYPD